MNCQQCLTIRRLFFLVFLFIMCLLAFNFSTFYLISLNSTTIDPSSIIHNNNNINNNNDELKYDLLINDNSFKNLDKINDLNVRVRELLRIRSSVLKELRSLERNRTSIIQELTVHNNELEKLKSTIGKKSNELERLQLHIKQAVVAQKEAKVLVGSMIEPPLNLLPKQAQAKNFIENEKATISHLNHNECQMHNCFDYSRCSLFSSFFVFIYNHDDDHHHVRSSFDQIIYDKFRSNIHVTNDPRIACIYLLIISEHFPYWNDRISFQNYLAALPYWAGDGRNHIIFNMNPKIDLNSIELNVKKAIIVQNQFSKSFSSLRHSFDLVIPNVQIIHSFNVNLNVKNFSPKLSPAKRKYFLTFLGRLRHENSDHNNNNTAYDDNLQLIIKNTMLNLLTKHSVVNHNEFLFDFDCDEKTKKLCDNQTIILLESTFTLIPIIIINNNSFHHDFYQRLFNALSTGSIPIIISNDIISLPFEDVIDWRKATIRLPIARITELYVLLKTYTDADIIELRRYGLHFYQTYFANLDKFIATFFAYFGTYRLQIPPSSPPSYRSIYYYNQPKYDIQFNSSDSLLTNSLIYDNDPSSDGDEFLGPIEPPFASISYHRNYSITMNNLYSIWNDISLTPFHTFPSLPFDPVLPSESKFIGSSYGFRPIGAGLGGSGKEFSESLGGNHIREQFTIVILTYERENVLLLILSHLKNLPYLNKVVIVWNSPQPPSIDIIWPDIGVDIVVIKSERNSLNNRFIPFDEIKTEAILSIDDDTNLRHDEIIFAFRVWREARDRIVGFPARFHSYETNEKSWYYNSSYTCEYSMILTGAAFFHKYYSYLYSYSMSSLIRDKVDEFMNCEDIAMNFLVSHVTRKPPIKVTSKWTFRCPACQTGLSENQSEHFLKRHKCINYFVSIYGYMPLLYTQFRADSVLFKTRVSHDKQKCFKYI
ncbi:exostosin-3-like [Dermatophagoides pteronyssinus]|uniref:exostosin-3-like n=1 Tax=Dermatophagoides pteronyssinus TaxID=6956 RepID=UPI003F6663EC